MAWWFITHPDSRTPMGYAALVLIAAFLVFMLALWWDYWRR